jgi:hypothetical protein
MNNDNGNFRFTSPGNRAALVVGHPGHELLVHGWLEETRPLVFVLTDGSGRSNESRLASTTKVIEQTGARAGSIYGRLADVAAYAALLNHEFDLFVGLARELCEAFIVERINFVAGDALEGYNPMHDVSRLVINAAVNAVSQRQEHRLANFEFSLVEPPCACPKESHANRIQRQLDDAAFTRKMIAARGYAELSGEVLAALKRTSTEAFRLECLHAAGSEEPGHDCADPPFYEQYGEKQVAAGHYRQVIRYQEHILPLTEALKRFAES